MNSWPNAASHQGPGVVCLDDQAMGGNLTVVEVPVGRVSDVHMACRKAEEAAARRSQAAAWLQKVVGCAKLPLEPTEEELRLCLRNGALLCRLMNRIEPGTVTKVVETNSSDGSLSAFQCFENLRNFLDAAQELRLPTFEVCDLEQSSLVTGSMGKVVDCILALKSYREWKQTGAMGFWKYAGSMRSPIRGNVHPRGHGKTDIGHKSSRKRLLPDSYIEAEQPLSDEPKGLVGHRGQTHEKTQDSTSDIEIDPSVPESTSAWISHLTVKFRDLLQVKSKPMQELSLKDNRGNLVELLNNVLSGKQPGEIPQLVELMMKKLIEEFQCRILAQKGHVEKLRSSKESATNVEQEAKLKEAKELLALASAEIQKLKSQCGGARLEVSGMKECWMRDIQGLGSQMLELAASAQGYRKVLAENRKLYNEVQDLKGSIRVYCRVRPSGGPESSGIVEFIGDDGEIMLCNPSKLAKDSKTFKFNKIFGPSATQESVYMDTQPLIRSVLDGYNVCIFAYGQTGSGKTYTMSGPNNLTEETWGVNYRALNDLFAIACNRNDLISYDISVQMIEIYNEHLRDLLAADGGAKKLEIRNSSQQNGVNVPDATMLPVTSTSDVLDLMKTGQRNRSVGSTAMNERSSRSHSVLTVHVRGTDLKSGAILHGSLHLVDLAGSERVDKSEATGERLKEAQFINKSLAALGDVIYALSAKGSHVPYRNSKLTQLLQDSLGGQAKTLMFVHMSPEVESYSETLSTLKFAERVATVELGAARSNRESADVRDLKEQLAALKDALAKKDAEIEKLKLTRSGSNDTGSGVRQSFCRQSHDELKAENYETSTHSALDARFHSLLHRSRLRNTPLRSSSALETRPTAEDWLVKMEYSSQSCAEEEVFESCISSDSGKQEEATVCPPLLTCASPRVTPAIHERVLTSKNTLSVSTSLRRPKPKASGLAASQQLLRKEAHMKAYSDQNSETDPSQCNDDAVSDSSDRENRLLKDQKITSTRRAEKPAYGRSPASIRKPQPGTQWRTPLQSQKLKSSDPRLSLDQSNRRLSSVGLPPDCSSVKRNSVTGRVAKDTARGPSASEGSGKPAFARHLFAIPNGTTKPTRS